MEKAGRGLGWGCAEAKEEGRAWFYVPGLAQWTHSRDHTLFRCAWYQRRFEAASWEALLRELDPFPKITDFLQDNPTAFTFADQPVPETELWRPLVPPGLHTGAGLCRVYFASD